MSPPLVRFSQLSLAPNMQTSRSTSHIRSMEKGKGRAAIAEGGLSSSSRQACVEGSPSSYDEEPDMKSEDRQHQDGETDEEDDDYEERTPEITDISWNGHTFALDHCRKDESTYAFLIAYADVQRYSIKIRNGSATPSCNCGASGSCMHIQWLGEQLSRASARAQSPGTALHQQITAIGLENVCRKLRWELRASGDEDYIDTAYQLLKKHVTSEPAKGQDIWTGQGRRRTRSMTMERMDVVRDIMATLTPHTVAEEYRVNLFDGSYDITGSKSIITGDLEATLTRFLLLEDVIFQRFEILIPPDVRASDYFRKMADKARETCNLLDEFSENGPRPNFYNHDVKWCARNLVRIVNSIQQNIKDREPLSFSSREAAASALVAILEMVVVERNTDVYQNITWSSPHYPGKLLIDRNLYTRLIGGKSPENPSDNTFVLSALQDLPEGRRFVESLEIVWSKLDSPGWPAPGSYLRKLNQIILNLKINHGSYGKRPAHTLDRNPKRMK